MVDRALINYLKDGFSKGYSKEDLKKILIENGWSQNEISEAIAIVSRMPSQKAQISQPQEQPKKLAVTTLNAIERQRLIPFVEAALLRDFSREDIKLALIKKGWPEDKVDEAFRLLDLKSKKEEEKPIESEYKPETGVEINAKLILSYLLSFVLITLVVGATVSLLFYVIAITNYEVIDPNTGALVKGACLEEKCADMKEYALKEIGIHSDSQDRGKLWTSLIIGAIVALAIMVSFTFVSFKTALLWTVNLLYFMFICYIAYLWIRFNYITLG